VLDPIEVLKSNDLFAVVGATQTREKFGYKIFRMLRDYDKTAYPVNPRYEEIDGEVCYSSIAEVPEKPGVVVSVVRPELTDALIKHCKEEGISLVWLQPGTYNDAVVEKCRSLGIKAIHGPCILVKLAEL
jgi:predicted CoA-binding protein